LDRGILLLLLLCAAVATYNILPISHMAHYYSSAPIYLEEHRGSLGYYARKLLHYYPLILGLLPLALLIGLRHSRRFTWFCAVIFGSVVLVHSGAAVKQMRYIYYVMPYMYAIIGVATAAVWPELKRTSQLVIQKLPPTRWLPAGWSGTLAVVLSAGVLLIAVVANTGFRISHGLISASGSDWLNSFHHRATDWAAATPALKDLVADTDVLISSAGVKALFYLGHFDYDLLLTLTREPSTGEEFGLDYRHGRPVIASPQSLAAIMDGNESGIVIIDKVHWRPGLSHKKVLKIQYN
jgi:hypothetical protein